MRPLGRILFQAGLQALSALSVRLPGPMVRWTLTGSKLPYAVWKLQDGPNILEGSKTSCLSIRLAWTCCMQASPFDLAFCLALGFQRTVTRMTPLTADSQATPPKQEFQETSRIGASSRRLERMTCGAEAGQTDCEVALAWVLGTAGFATLPTLMEVCKRLRMVRADERLLALARLEATTRI